MAKNKIEKLIVRKYYSTFFNFCVFVRFIKIKEVSTIKLQDRILKEVSFYFNKKHPFFLITALYMSPRLLIPLLGIFWWLDGLANIPGENDPAKDRIIMSRGKIKRQLRALRREYMREHPEEFDGTLDPILSGNKSTRRAGKKNKGKQMIINLGDCGTWTEQDWEDYYMTKYGGEYLSSLEGKSTTVFSETKETKPTVDIKTWEEGSIDESTDDEIPEDEIRVDNLYNSLNNGYIISLEKFLKRKYNIYSTGFGYALERINRDESGVYLDIDFNFVKVWEGDNKVELLKTIISEIDKGEIQRTTEDSLQNILDRYSGDASKIPQNKQRLLTELFKVSSIPEDLNLKKVGK